MRILIVSHYFKPEVGAPQTRLGEIAKLWAAGGDDVTVLTGFPNHPTGVVPPDYRGRIRMVEMRDGYRIVRTWLYATRNERIVRKTLGHISFMLTSVVLGFRKVGPVDVVVCSSPTFFSIFSGWLIARMKRARFVLEIRDLWPAAIVELGVLTNRRIIAVLEAIERWCYRRADLVVPVTRGLALAIGSKGIPASKVKTITNGVDLERFEAVKDVGVTRSGLGARSDDVLVLYAGTHGMLYDLELVADAAAQLTQERFHFAFVGEGVGKAGLSSRVDALGLGNVTMYPAVPGEDVPQIMGAADICLLPVKESPIAEMSLAAKMFEYLAAGRAVVALTRGESTEVLRDAGAIVLEPGDLGGFVGVLRELAADPDRRARIGAAGRAYVGEHYDRRVLAAEYRRMIDELTAR